MPKAGVGRHFKAHFKAIYKENMFKWLPEGDKEKRRQAFAQWENILRAKGWFLFGLGFLLVFAWQAEINMNALM